MGFFKRPEQRVVIEPTGVVRAKAHVVGLQVVRAAFMKPPARFPQRRLFELRNAVVNHGALSKTAAFHGGSVK